MSKFAKNNSILVIDKVSTIEPKTKTAFEFIAKMRKQNELLANSRKIGIITSRSFDNFKRAFKNLPEVNLLSAKSLNSYELSRQNYLMFTAAAIKELTK